MKDRSLDHLGYVGSVGRRARVLGHGCKTNLVIDHQMDRSAGAIAFELGKIENLGNRTLPGESSIPVDEKRQDCLAVGLGTVIAGETLAGAGLSLDHRIDGFKVTRVGGKTDPNLAIFQLANLLVTQVVFHVTIPGHQIGNVVGGKLIE